MFVRTITLTALAGEDSFQTRCALCHGGDGTDRAPSILPTLSALAPDQLRTIISNGVPAKGMPAFEIPDAELGDLIAYLKNLGRRSPLPPATLGHPNLEMAQFDSSMVAHSTEPS